MAELPPDEDPYWAGPPLEAAPAEVQRAALCDQEWTIEPLRWLYCGLGGAVDDAGVAVERAVDSAGDALDGAVDAVTGYQPDYVRLGLGATLGLAVVAGGVLVAGDLLLFRGAGLQTILGVARQR